MLWSSRKAATEVSGPFHLCFTDLKEQITKTYLTAAMPWANEIELMLICQVFVEAWLFQAIELQRYTNKMTHPCYWDHSLSDRQEGWQYSPVSVQQEGLEATLCCGNKDVPYPAGSVYCTKEELLTNWTKMFEKATFEQNTEWPALCSQAGQDWRTGQERVWGQESLLISDARRME